MKTVLRSLRLAIFTVVAVLSSSAWASISLQLLSSENSTVSVFPGESFTVDIVMQSDSEDSFNVVELQIEMTTAGIRYDGYNWQAPFAQQPPVDEDPFTQPKSAELPQILTADTLDDTTEVDFSLYNLSEEAKVIGQGEDYTIVSCNFTVPTGFEWHGTYSMTIDKDDSNVGFTDDAFNRVTVTTVNPLEFNIVPEPATSAFIMGAGGLGWILLMRRKLRNKNRS